MDNYRATTFVVKKVCRKNYKKFRLQWVFHERRGVSGSNQVLGSVLLNQYKKLLETTTAISIAMPIQEATS